MNINIAKQKQVSNRLTKLFTQGKKGLLNIYCTAGFPRLQDTVPIIKALEKSGADIVELGIPYSDPLADGPVIQKSGSKALENGMTVNVLFEQLKDLRKDVNIPIVLMGYINPVLQYGIEAFCAKCAEVGVDGLILPDLPVDQYMDNYQPIFEKHNLSNIFLITPRSSDARIQYLDQCSSGFIYAVSTLSTTGSASANMNASDEYLKRIGNMGLKNPILTGFNIKDKESFDVASRHTDGGIIGSAFIRHIENSRDLDTDIQQFIYKIKGR
ncbi:MAG: tryptophan synthase alpha chain [Polaribacter sp.]|jgi:tryptophan synthase alpha chain